jgi:hypothetical protein
LTKNPKVKGEAPMKMEITVPEVVDLIKQIRQQPEGLFEMIRTNVRETVGEYLSELMDVELTQVRAVGGSGQAIILKSLDECSINTHFRALYPAF